MRLSRLLVRIVSALGRAILVAIACAVLIAAAAILALDTPPGRAFVAARVTTLLKGTFRGTLVIERIGSLGLAGAGGIRVRIRDPEGRQVLFADGVEGRFASLPFLRSLIGSGPLEITVSAARVAFVDVSLDTDESGNLVLLRAFEPKKPDVTSPSEPGRGVVVTIADASLRRGWAHGQPSGVPVDAEVVNGHSRVTASPKGLEVSIESATVDSRSSPGGADPRGSVVCEIWLPAEGPHSIRGMFTGHIGGVPAAVTTRLLGDRIDLSVEAQQTTATKSEQAGLVGLLPADFALRADASGPLEKVSVRARADAGRAVADVEGTLSLVPKFSVQATAHFRHVDLESVVPDAPKSDLGGVAQGSLVIDDGEPSVRFSLNTYSGRISGTQVPEAKVTGTVHRGVIDARLVAEYRGADLRAAVSLRPERAGPILELDASARVNDLLRTTGSVAAGSGAAFAQAAMNLRSGHVHGKVVAWARDLSRADLRIGRAYLDTTFDGDTKNPGVQSSFTLERVAVGERRFRGAAGTWQGTLLRAAVEASLEGESRAPSVEARGDLSLESGLTLRNVSVTAKRDEAQAVIEAALVHVGASGGRIEQAVVRGLGEAATVDGTLVGNTGSLAVDAPLIDMRRAARVMGLDPKRFRGEASAMINVAMTPAFTRGIVDVELRDVVFGGRAGHGRLRAHVYGDRVDASCLGAWGGSRVDFRAAGVELDGPIVRPKSWERARGTFDLHAAVNLETIEDLVPEGTLPFDSLSGVASIDAHVERPASEETPAVSLSLHTNGLELSRPGAALVPAGSVKVRAPSSMRISGVDVDLDMKLDPAHEESHIRALLHDSRGELATVTLESQPIPFVAAADDPSNLLAFFRSSPSRIRVAIPHRRFADLPMGWARQDLRGGFGAVLEAAGTLDDPDIDASLSVSELSPRRSRGEAAFDGRVSAHYSGGNLSAEANVFDSGRPVMNATTRAHMDFADVIDGQLDEFDVSARATLDRFPLESLDPLAARRVKGALSGDVDVALGTKVTPHLRARLEATRLSVGRAHDNRAKVIIDAEGGMMKASAEVEQPDGSANLKATIPVVLPFATSSDSSPPAVRPAELTLKAKRFRLAVVRPLLEGVVNGVDGRLDGNVEATVSDSGKQMTSRGDLRISEGRAELAALGEGFQAIEANVKLERDGNMTVTDFKAEGSTGKVTGSGTLHFSGYSLDRAQAAFWIPRRDPLPVAVGGETLAETYGTFRAALTRANASSPLQVRVEVEKAGVILPTQSSHALQPLEPAERIRIGVAKGPGELEALQGGPVASPEPSEVAGPTITVVARDVEVRRGTELSVRLDGEPVIKTGRDEGVYGQITLRGGFFDVQGKRFEIEKGTITFDGEADNPQVVVTAAWTAPEETRVYADFVGPLKTGKVTLRSEPPHTKSEILSLVLFGTTTGNAAPASGGSVAGSSAAGAASLGSGFAAQGLNRAMADLTGVEVTARVDTSQSANPRPELEVRVARDVTVAIAHVVGVPPPGTNPDRNFATVGVHILRNWTLETKIGDQGTSLMDLVWQYRY